MREVLTTHRIRTFAGNDTIHRALSDPDVFLPGDVGVLRALRAIGGGSRAAADAMLTVDRWRPWRSYVVHHLWATAESAQSRVAEAQDDDVAV